MSKQKHSHVFDAPPVVGEVVSGTGRGPGYETRFSGTYLGIGPSEWDGEPYHFFENGIMGVTPQTRFGLPVSQDAK